MNIYLNTETDFVHNGLGFLTDILNVSVIDTLNGDYSLYFEYKINGRLSEYIKNENIVKCKVSDGSKQLFVIKNVVKTFDTIQVSCKHIFYTLLDNFLEDVAPTNLSCHSFLKWIFDRTNYSNSFQVSSDITTVKSGRYVRKNPVEALLGDDSNSVINLFGGEIKRDNFKISINKRIGNDNGVKLVIGKNITGINISIDTSNIHTRIMPQGFDGLFLPEKYVDSPLIETYPNPKIYKVEFDDIKYAPDDEDAYQDIENAYTALRNATNELFESGVDKPTINIKIDWIELSKTNEYKNYSNLEKVLLGDTLTVDLLGITYQTRVVKTIYNPLTDRIDSFEVGTVKANIVTSTNSIQNQIKKISPNSILETAKENATQMLTQAMGGFVVKTQNEIFIMDTDNPDTATKVWRWNTNGLGYSKNGVDGPYETAMTSDGQIVADFITTGKLNTNVIEGYEQLVTTVSDINDTQDTQDKKISQVIQTVDTIEQQISGEYGMENEVLGINQVFIEDALKYYPLELKISGYSNTKNLLYPGTFYPSVGYVPLAYKESELSQLTICVDSQDRNNPTENLKEYPITINEPLRSLGTIKDELETSISSEGEITGTITRYLAYTGSQIIKLGKPVIETFTVPQIELLEHSNYIYIKEQPNYQLYVKYLLYSELNKHLATKVELATSRKQTEDSITDKVTATYSTKEELAQEKSERIQTANEINQIVSKKVGNDEIKSKINQSAESVKIEAKNLDLTGLVTVNDLGTSGKSIINGSNITTGTISADRVTGGTLKGTTIEGNTINGGTINGTTINTDKDLTVGNNAYIGQNQSSKTVDVKSLCFSGDSYIKRTRINDYEHLTLLSNSVGVVTPYGFSAGSNGIESFRTSSENFQLYTSDGVTIGGGHGFIYMSHQPNIDSDKRLKQEIKDIDVSWIDDLDIKEFEYIKTPNKKQIGLIAQDYIDEDYSKYFLNKNEDGYYSVAYGNITNALIKYCQELKQEVENLKQEVEALKNEK